MSYCEWYFEVLRKLIRVCGVCYGYHICVYATYVFENKNKMPYWINKCQSIKYWFIRCSLPLLLGPSYLHPISISQTYSMDAYFRQTWIDKRLTFNGTHEMMAVQIKLLEKIWKPDTFFYNGHGSYLHTTTSPNKLLRIMKNGTILYSMR